MVCIFSPVYSIEKSYDECAEVASKCIVQYDRNTIVFVNNPQFVSANKTSYPITKDILPNNSVVFQWLRII